MTLYKTIWTLLKANKSNLLIGVIITVVATFFFAQNIDVENTSLQDAKIALISEEESPVVEGLRKYLNDKETVVTLDGTSQKEIDDALYFNRVNNLTSACRLYRTSRSRKDADDQDTESPRCLF